MSRFLSTPPFADPSTDIPCIHSDAAIPGTTPPSVEESVRAYQLCMEYHILPKLAAVHERELRTVAELSAGLEARYVESSEELVQNRDRLRRMSEIINAASTIMGQTQSENLRMGGGEDSVGGRGGKRLGRFFSDGLAGIMGGFSSRVTVNAEMKDTMEKGENESRLMDEDEETEIDKGELMDDEAGEEDDGEKLIDAGAEEMDEVKVLKAGEGIIPHRLQEKKSEGLRSSASKSSKVHFKDVPKKKKRKCKGISDE